ncbi:MAG: glycoside hydrolase family 97 catalytic domain-containing protein, partial [Chitinophagaceae bacterium]
MKYFFPSKSVQLFILVFSLLTCKSSIGQSWELKSPDNSIRMTVSQVANRETSLEYKVDVIRDGKAIVVLENSPLGIVRKDQHFSNNLSFVSKGEIKTIDETYQMLTGRQRLCRNKANELELTFKNQEGSLITIVWRVYDDGVAFNYMFPEKSDKLFTITRELTGFKIPENGKAWIEKYDIASTYTPAYEQFYENGIPVGTPSPNVEGWAFPALFNTNGNWMLISEANLAANYCGVRFEQNAPNGMYRLRFPNAKDAEGYGDVEPQSILPWLMPWRTIIIGSTPATIFESEMVTNLSDPAIPGDFTWVKPGRASWSWLSDNESPKNYQTLQQFVDLAANMKWEYSLVDANWDLMTGGNIEQLVKYAQSKGVGILMWYNSGGPQNTVSERPRDIIFDPQKRKDEFKKLKAWGVKGVKIDFWQSDKQNMIALYHEVMRDAANNQIMVNFHGCTIPRGWSRTYPNLVAMESVKGEECYLFDSSYTEQAPVQNSILPFTRNVIGPMDYTPMGLTNFKFPHTTTFAHELALTLVFNTGIVHFADNVKAYLSLPDFVKEFIQHLPVVFDET